jgi:hypothetical protein
VAAQSTVVLSLRWMYLELTEVLMMMTLMLMKKTDRQMRTKVGEIVRLLAFQCTLKQSVKRPRPRFINVHTHT